MREEESSKRSALLINISVCTVKLSGSNVVSASISRFDGARYFTNFVDIGDECLPFPPVQPDKYGRLIHCRLRRYLFNSYYT